MQQVVKAVTVCRFLGLVLAFVATGSFGAESSSTVRVCYETWDPYTFRDDAGEMHGIAVELLNTALDELGHVARYEELPFKRCLAEVRAGTADIAMPVIRGRGYLSHSQTVFAHWTLAAIVPQSLAINGPINLNTLNDFSVILISGYQYPENISRWAGSHSDIAEVTYSADGEGLVPFRMLEFGRADVFIEDNFWSAKLIEDHNLPLRVMEPALGSAINVAGYHEELADLRDGVDRVLETRGQAFRDALFMKYTGHPESYFFSQHETTATSTPVLLQNVSGVIGQRAAPNDDFTSSSTR